MFGQSLHREVILRSKGLVAVLVELRAIGQEHASMMWKAGLECHEEDITDEIFTILSSVLHRFTEQAQSSVLDLILDSCNDTDPHTEQQISIFLEKINACVSTIPFLPRSALRRLIDIAWMMFKRESFLSLKNHTKIEHLLTGSVSSFFHLSFLYLCIKSTV